MPDKRYKEFMKVPSNVARWVRRELLLTVVFLLPGLAFLQTTGDIGIYFRHRVPDGQILYLGAKLCGLYAVIFLWLQLLQGLLHASGYRFLNSNGNPGFHRNLGLLVVFLFLTHIALFVSAVSLRSGHFVYQLLLPRFFGAYYPSILSMGLIGAWLLLIAAAIGAMRRRSKRNGWVWVHRLTWGAFFLVYFHSYLIGSETRVGLVPWLFYFMFGTTVMAMGLRIWKGAVVGSCLFGGARPVRDCSKKGA